MPTTADLRASHINLYNKKNQLTAPTKNTVAVFSSQERKKNKEKKLREKKGAPISTSCLCEAN